jgi:hypothetical protein
MVKYIIASVSTELRLERRCPHCQRKKGEFRLRDVFIYLLQSVRFYWLHRDIPWRQVRVPSFPVGFTVLSGFFYELPVLIKAASRVQEPFNLAKFLVAIIVCLAFGSAVFFTLNLIIRGAFEIILRRFKKDGEGAAEYSPKLGAQRVCYFSSVFQLLLFFVYAGSYILDSHYKLMGWGAHVLFATILLFCIIRLLAVFQSMRYETDGSTSAGLLALIPCFDVWLFLGGTIIPCILL